MTNRNKTIVIGVVVTVVVLAAIGYLLRDRILPLFFPVTQSSIEVGVSRGDENSVSAISADLRTPWGVVFLPNGEMLVTERPGTVKRIAENNTSYEIEGVVETSEGGLLGIALHPEFTKNNFVYLYSTYRNDGALLNRVQRYEYRNDTLSIESSILDGIPGSSTHDGGMIAFGPDQKLYITTGDAGNPSSAQDTTTLSGKILRLNDDGTIPGDNPFENAVFSYGHRNPQGLAWDDDGRLWATEHGPSGLESGRDEVNLIESGANYGWPIITGDQTQTGMRSPIIQSGDSETWAPGGIAYVDGALYFAGLRGQSLYQAKITEGDTPGLSLKRHFIEQYGRMRAVVAYQNSIYVTTSNTDGRGRPMAGDDRILQIRTDLFKR